MRQCKVCTKEIVKNPHESYKQHNKRVTCRVVCQAKLRLGVPLSEVTKKKLSRAMLGRKLPKEQIQRLRESKLGEKSPFWKGGAMKNYALHVQIRKSNEYKLWRKAVFERDNYTCVLCGARNGNGKAITLNADHIKPFSLFPELRFAIDNGRTLCLPCHKKTDTYAGRGLKRKTK
jgi:hypothetical protein